IIGPGGTGKVTTDFFGRNDVAYSVAIQTDGKIVAAGYADNVSDVRDFALARYNPDGSLDTASFNSASNPPGPGPGKVTTDFFGLNVHEHHVAIHTHVNIVVACPAPHPFENYVFALARYNPDCTRDTALGKVTNDFLETHDQANSVALQPEGKIVAAGYPY